MYDVLRVLEMIPDRLEQGSPVFRDNNGEIIFISNDEISTDTVVFEVGKKYLAWIVKDIDKKSYARFTLDGVLLSDFIINKISVINIHDLYNMAKSKPMSECVIFSNTMYNHDIGYYNSVDAVDIEGRMSKSKLAKDLDNMRINSELDEFVYELGTLFIYIHNVYEKIILKEIL